MNCRGDFSSGVLMEVTLVAFSGAHCVRAWSGSQTTSTSSTKLSCAMRSAPGVEQ